MPAWLNSDLVTALVIAAPFELARNRTMSPALASWSFLVRRNVSTRFGPLLLLPIPEVEVGNTLLFLIASGADEDPTILYSDYRQVF